MANKLYNLEYLNSISGGDQAFIMDMILTFISSTPDELGKINDFVTSSNWSQTGEAAHRFSSSLLFLGLDSLKQVSAEIEMLSLQGDDVEKIPELLVKLENGCNQVIAELESDFNV